MHFGCRGLGHTSATRYLKAAGGKDGMDVPPAVVDEDSELGRRYIAAMELAGRYAYAGREWVVERVRQIIGGAVTDMVHNHHNYAWRETPRRRRSLGRAQGRDAGLSGPARLRRRLDGRRRRDPRRRREREVARVALLDGARRGPPVRPQGGEAAASPARADGRVAAASAACTLVGADLDESPMAYRRLPDVLAHHAGTVKVLHTLRPFAVAMAGEGEFDPWKD